MEKEREREGVIEEDEKALLLLGLWAWLDIVVVIKRSQLGSCVVFFFVPTVSGRETEHKPRGLIHLGVVLT